MTEFVEISINIAQIDRAYHYSVPAELQGRLKPGSLVIVPFGKQVAQGVVLSMIETPEVADPLPVSELLSEDTLLTLQQLDLARWISMTTFAPLGASVNLMIPTGISQRADILLSLNKPLNEIPEEFAPLQKRLLKLLKNKGDLRGGQLDRTFGQLEWRGSMEKLRKTGWIKTTSVLPPPRVASKTTRTAALSIPPEAVTAMELSLLGKNDLTQQRRLRVIQKLAAEALPIDFSWIYAETGASYSDLKYLAENGLLHFNETEVWRDPLEQIEPMLSAEPELTEDQLKLWKNLMMIMKQTEFKPVLIHGVTGSGKTEIYLRAAKQALQEGQQVLILVPEIAMTPQTVRRFLARFPNQVGLYHSKLSEGERYDTWRRVRKGDLKVIIGSRSALFVPFPKLGLIVIDECDNDSYDETDRIPYYHAVETAEEYAKICQAKLILGSANPRITQYFQARKGTWHLLVLPRRILAHKESLIQQANTLHFPLPAFPDHEALLTFELPKVELVDMRRELIEGNSSILSRTLSNEIHKVLALGQQAILFLNRKGTATYVFCRNCGHVLRCPRDNQPLVYHSSRSALLCHLCGYSRNLPDKCPNCGSRQIRQLGLGTEKLEGQIKASFPEARVLRWDAETTQSKGGHELILSHFSAHRADILIGTQMLAKGLDLPLVTLVGIILAEVGLNLPDYRAAERTFQVLTQVAGRAGRSPLGGRVIMQTYQPDHYVIQAAARHAFHDFYEKELEYRRDLWYPPFSQLVRLEYHHFDQERVESEANTLAGIIRSEIEARKIQTLDIIGPNPCYYEKLGGHYRWQIILRGKDPVSLLDQLPLNNWQIEVDPPNLL